MIGSVAVNTPVIDILCVFVMYNVVVDSLILFSCFIGVFDSFSPLFTVEPFDFTLGFKMIRHPV